MYKIWYKVFFISIIAGMLGCGSQNNTAISTTDTVDHTTLSKPLDIAVNSQSNELFVSNNLKHSILVFKRTANGNALPSRVISGSNTTISWPDNLILNPALNEIIVSSGMNNEILGFPLSSDGDVNPSWHQFLTHTEDVVGFDISVDKNVLVVFDGITGSLVSYPLTGTGKLDYYHRLTVSAFYDKGSIMDMAIDNVNKNIYILLERALAVYPLGFTEATEPLWTMTSVDISSGSKMAIDNVNNEIAIVNHAGNNIVFFPLTGNGDLNALRRISGTNTLLNKPEGIAIDTVNNEIFLTNTGNNSITVYSRTANDNTAPLRIIKGPTKN